MIPAWRSSQPAYDHTTSHASPPGGPSMCADRDCRHFNDGADDPNVPLPTFIWPTQGCYAAWLSAQGGPLLTSVAVVDRPTKRSEEPPLTWLGPDPKQPGVSELTWRGDRAS